MSRRERLEVLGDKMRKFNNVYVKNFSEEIDDEKLREMFEPYGKIISAKVKNKHKHCNILINKSFDLVLNIKKKNKEICALMT